MTMNVRSLTKNKSAMALVLEKECPSIMCLQETWLNKLAPNLHGEYDRMQSDPKKNEGVAIYTQKKIAAKAYLKEHWTSNIMLIRVGNLIVINTYVSEGWKREITSNVKNLSR